MVGDASRSRVVSASARMVGLTRERVVPAVPALALPAAVDTLLPDPAGGQTAEDQIGNHPAEWSRARAAGYEVLVEYKWQTPDEG